MAKIGRWITIAALLFWLYKGVDCHLDNIKKQRIENLIQNATEYIQKDFKVFYGRELTPIEQDSTQRTFTKMQKNTTFLMIGLWLLSLMRVILRMPHST